MLYVWKFVAISHPYRLDKLFKTLQWTYIKYKIQYKYSQVRASHVIIRHIRHIVQNSQSSVSPLLGTHPTKSIQIHTRISTNGKRTKSNLLSYVSIFRINSSSHRNYWKFPSISFRFVSIQQQVTSWKKYTGVYLWKSRRSQRKTHSLFT